LILKMRPMGAFEGPAKYKIGPSETPSVVSSGSIFASQKLDLKQQIKILVKLQALDSQIYELNAERKKVPEELNLLKQEYKEREEKVKQTEQKLKNRQLEIKKMEGDLKSKEETIKKHNVQLYQVKTNKEYSSLEAEIKNLKADVSLLEEKIIGLLDEVEEINKTFLQQKEDLNKEREKLKQEEELAERRCQEIDEKIKELNKKKEPFVARIEPSLLSQYERILVKKGGKAMSAVKDGACGECRFMLTPQVIEEIKMGEELIFCNSCSRILYETSVETDV